MQLPNSSWNSLDRQAKFLFDQIAADYHRYRPGYPPELVDDIIRLSGLPSHGKIFEIGAGTGIATLLFAKRGYPVTSLEMGANLSATAQTNCQEFPNVHILPISFEEWPVFKRIALIWYFPPKRFTGSNRFLVLPSAVKPLMIKDRLPYFGTNIRNPMMIFMKYSRRYIGKLRRSFAEI